MREFSIVVATDANNGIGKNGTLPWHLPGDMKHFRNLTTGVDEVGKKNAVIIGRKTWESIPPKFRPLPGRINIVLSRSSDLKLPVDVLRAKDFQEVFRLLEKPPLSQMVERVFVVGGAQVYKESLKHKECAMIYITQILNSFDCDAHFPDYHVDFERYEISSPQKEGDITYFFSKYRRHTH